MEPDKLFLTGVMPAMLGSKGSHGFTECLVRVLSGIFDKLTSPVLMLSSFNEAEGRCVLASLLWCVLSQVDTCFFSPLGPPPTCNLFDRFFNIQAETVKVLLLGNKIYTF